MCCGCLMIASVRQPVPDPHAWHSNHVPAPSATRTAWCQYLCSLHPHLVTGWPRLTNTTCLLWLLLQYTSAWGFYGLLAWLPTFFMEHCGVSLGTLGGYTVGPYVLQALVGASAGLLADRLINQQRWRVRDVRVAMQVAGMLGPALCMTAAASPAGAASPLLAASLLTLGMGASALTCSECLGACWTG